MYFDEWSFRIQKFLRPRQKLYLLGDWGNNRFVFEGKPGHFLCGLEHKTCGDGIAQESFCITRIVIPGEKTQEGELALASELLKHSLSHGAKRSLVLYSPSGWPREAWKLQKDGIIWDR